MLKQRSRNPIFLVVFFVRVNSNFFPLSPHQDIFVVNSLNFEMENNISTVDPDFIGIVRLEIGPTFTNNICTPFFLKLPLRQATSASSAQVRTGSA